MKNVIMSKSLATLVFFILFSVDKVAAQDEKIAISRVKNPDNSVDFNYTKTVPGNYFVEFHLDSLINVADASKIQKAYDINANSDSGPLFKLYPEDQNEEILTTYNYSYRKGNFNPTVDNSIMYILPFKENKNILINESVRSDVGDDIWKTYVVYSKSKDTIYAMRKGIVSGIEKRAVTSNGNTDLRIAIIVDHADGTSASYLGIDESSLNVKVSDTVFPRTRLGIVDDVINPDQNHSFKFNIYYFSNEEVQTGEGRKMKITERSVIPPFYSSIGLERLVGYKMYTVKFNDKILYKEMTEEEMAKQKLLPKN